MYGTDEHRYVVSRMSSATRELARQISALGSINDDLHDDDPAATREARDELREARRLIGAALVACDTTITLLPTPVKS